MLIPFPNGSGSVPGLARGCSDATFSDSAQSLPGGLFGRWHDPEVTICCALRGYLFHIFRYS